MPTPLVGECASCAGRRSHLSGCHFSRTGRVGRRSLWHRRRRPHPRPRGCRMHLDLRRVGSCVAAAGLQRRDVHGSAAGDGGELGDPPVVERDLPAEPGFPPNVDEPMWREACRVGVGGAGRAADGVKRADQPLDLRGGQRVGHGRRVDPCFEEDVVAHPVPHPAAQPSLIEQHGLDGPPSLLQDLDRVRERHSVDGVSGVGRELAHGGLDDRVPPKQQQPQPSWVGEGQLGPRGKGEPELGKTRGPGLRGFGSGVPHPLDPANLQRPRHPEVDQQALPDRPRLRHRATRGMRGDVDPHLLPLPPRPDHCRVQQRRGKVCLGDPFANDQPVKQPVAAAAPALPGAHRGNPLAQQLLLHHSPRRFHLGQLWHPAVAEVDALFS
eukprot:m.221153 g.221153  ORF g.221153 m.221153 type:complete len:382 (+) comp15608_c0_seq5:588-1733(+)